MSKYLVHSVDARHFAVEKYYLFQANPEGKPKVVVTLLVNEPQGGQILDQLINQGGPVEVELQGPKVVEAHIIP